MFQNLDKRQKWGATGLGVFMLFVLGVIGSSYMYKPQPFEVQQQSFAPSTAPDLIRPVQIKVSGSVRSPGEYTLAAGSNVSDAIDMAGGETLEANLTSLDLTLPLEQNIALYVPAIGSKVQAENYLSKSKQSKELAPYSISINDASAEVLDQLPYIGPKKAAAIIEYRETIGEFKAVEEIKGVKGIGDGIYARIKPYIKL